MLSPRIFLSALVTIAMLLGIHEILQMPAVLEHVETDSAQLGRVASKLASSRSRNGEGRGAAHMVRIPNAVLSLLEAAKPADQSMVSFLKEAAVTVALQRLEDSQK